MLNSTQPKTTRTFEAPRSPPALKPPPRRDRGPLADPEESTEQSVRGTAEALFSGRLPWSRTAADVRKALAYAGDPPRGASKRAALRWLERFLDGLLMAHELDGRGEYRP